MVAGLLSSWIAVVQSRSHAAVFLPRDRVTA